MPLYELTHDAITALAITTLEKQSFGERRDVQRLLKTSIEALGEDLLVIAEEFSPWEDSKRRIDLLAVDAEGKFVVIELKRTEDGGHMDLQAIRYAAMISTMTFQRATEAYATFLGVGTSLEQARVKLLDFLQPEDPAEEYDLERFGKAVRIVLVSANFGKEITTAVLWLNLSGLDIQCIRIRPYLYRGQTIIDLERLIPLPGAEAYTVRMKEKQEEKRATSQAHSGVDWTRYDLVVNGNAFLNLTKRELMWRLVRMALDLGVAMTDIQAVFWAHKFFIVDGEVSHSEFLEEFARAKTVLGTEYNAGRYFLDEKRLFRENGKTFSLSNQWGKATMSKAQQLFSILPTTNKSLSPASENQEMPSD